MHGRDDGSGDVFRRIDLEARAPVRLGRSPRAVREIATMALASLNGDAAAAAYDLVRLPKLPTETPP